MVWFNNLTPPTPPKKKKKKIDETFAVSTGVEPPRGRRSKKKNLYWGSGIKRRTMMAMRHADDRSDLLEVQWGFAHIGTSMSFSTTSLMAYGANLRKG